MTLLKYAFVVGLFFLAACYPLNANRLEIRNYENAPLSAIEIRLGGGYYKVDLINPKGVAVINFEPVSDSDVRVDYVIRGQKKTCVGDVYITTGLRKKILVVIIPDQRCKVEEVD